MLPNHLLLIRSKAFAYNEQTANSNAFQHRPSEDSSTAINETDQLIKSLKKQNISLRVFEDDNKERPDAIFPNNWIAQIPGGPLCVFPMLSENRQREVREDIIAQLMTDLNLKESDLLDVRKMAAKGEALEGTGSIVFHHPSKTAFAGISERTSASLFEKFCAAIGYTAVSFLATDPSGQPIYHTNVMLSIGNNNALICSASIAESVEREMVLAKLKAIGLTIMDLTFGQMSSFCANAIEVENRVGERYWLMSELAHGSLSTGQQWDLAEVSTILSSPIPTIEHIGGGSVRCMIAGFYKPSKQDNV